MKKSKMEDLLSRSLAGGLGSLLVAFLIFFSNFEFFRPIFTGCVSIIAAIALWEYYQLVEKKGVRTAYLIGLITAVAYIFSVFFQTLFGDVLRQLPAFILGISFFVTFIFYASIGKDAILGLATTLFGIFYIVIPISIFVRISFLFMHSSFRYEGAFWLLYLIATTKASDMGGYFIGRWVGRKKLAIRLSPNKTYEGALGGLIFSILISCLIAYLGRRVGIFLELSFLTAVWLGAILGLFSLLGDLAESLLKRDVDAKDSNTIPGIGGFLDMVDSLLFTAPLLYIFLKLTSVLEGV